MQKSLNEHKSSGRKKVRFGYHQVTQFKAGREFYHKVTLS
jgi:hypothetical protein